MTDEELEAAGWIRWEDTEWWLTPEFPDRRYSRDLAERQVRPPDPVVWPTE
jgi:hypothetical protein